MNYLPTDDKQRKLLPIWQMITRYFPKGFRELTRVCVANNVRYNPERDPADINWARGKSKDQLGSSLRHMLEAAIDGKVFEDEPSPADGKPIYILAENAWRALAALELEIEEQEAKVGFKALLVPTPILDLLKLQDEEYKRAPKRMGTAARGAAELHPPSILDSPTPPGVDSKNST